MSRPSLLIYKKRADEQDARKVEAAEKPTFVRYFIKYCEWMRVVNFSEMTIIGKERHLARFFAWCNDRGVEEIGEVTPVLLEQYQKHLYRYRNAKNGQPLSVVSQMGELSDMRTFFKWLARKKYLAMNPASEIDLPKLPRRLPRNVMSIAETERVLAEIDTNTAAGLRNRTMLEILYSTGVRRRELARVCVRDIDHGRGMLTVRLGKGKRDRIIPIGERALAWVDRYLEEFRSRYAVEPDTGLLFLTVRGKPVTPDQITQLASRYVKKSEITKSGACHMFRHTMATLMLEGGADIRFIQKMLGHKQLNTTDIYTHVHDRKLKEVHTAMHPGALLRPHKDRKAGEESIQGVDPASDI